MRILAIVQETHVVQTLHLPVLNATCSHGLLGHVCFW